jgi:hypothetical protein
VHRYRRRDELPGADGHNTGVPSRALRTRDRGACSYALRGARVTRINLQAHGHGPGRMPRPQPAGGCRLPKGALRSSATVLRCLREVSYPCGCGMARSSTMQAPRRARARQAGTTSEPGGRSQPWLREPHRDTACNRLALPTKNVGPHIQCRALPAVVEKRVCAVRVGLSSEVHEEPIRRTRVSTHSVCAGGSIGLTACRVKKKRLYFEGTNV